MANRLAIHMCCLMLLTACEQRQLPQPAQTPHVSSSALPTPEIKWAVANKRKLADTVRAALVKADPEIAAENAKYEAALKERDSLAGQLDGLKMEARDRCAREKLDGKAKDARPNEGKTSNAQGSSSAPLLEMQGIQRGRSNPEFLDCINKSQEDSRIQDLQAKMKSIYEFAEKRQRNDQLLRQRADIAYTELLDSYGKTHNYQLIVNGGPELVLFNQSKVVLDVTEDIEDFLARNPPTPK